jgi:ribosomal-protein-alanine N-acetyltransferase
VTAIESAIYPFPWTSGNFLDSLASGYDAWLLCDARNEVCAYYFLMMVVDEAHLLNITVRGDLHGSGLGRSMLDHVAQVARGKGMESLLLEVRPSNTRAIVIYERYGFVRIGRRKAYYPAAGDAREDAIVMRFTL